MAETRRSRAAHTIVNRFTSMRQSVKTKCGRMTQSSRRWIPGLVAMCSTIFYVVLLILYSQQAKYTFQVSRMAKAEYCSIDFLGHKSQSLKQTSCCEVWLGVVCKRLNTMPCPSISVIYKLSAEDFERAGYINYWDPHHLIARYATNSHCMIVPITCPEPEDHAAYTQAEVDRGYTMKQSLECYVYKDAPERPLVIKAQLLPHLSLALLLFIAPPMIILGSLITCVALRSENEDQAVETSNNEKDCSVIEFVSDNNKMSNTTEGQPEGQPRGQSGQPDEQLDGKVDSTNKIELQANTEIITTL